MLACVVLCESRENPGTAQLVYFPHKDLVLLNNFVASLDAPVSDNGAPESQDNYFVLCYA